MLAIHEKMVYNTYVMDRLLAKGDIDMANILESTVNGKYLMFRGKPLVRQGNQICYGDMQDKYVMFLIILSEKTVKVGDADVTLPDKIIGQIVNTDPNAPFSEKIAKQFEKTGLYDAFCTGLITLDRLNGAK